MTDAHVVQALLSDAPMVAVEAPAGTGKTHISAELARVLAAGLTGGKEVLLLAHTHAAIDEFKVRIGTRPGIRFETLDAFCLNLLRAHPRASGLPLPLRPDHADASHWFSALTSSAADLLERAPDVARQIALHHPVVFFDEHQDARKTQHQVALCLRDSGARVRVLGDPMQAIYAFGGEPAVDWRVVCSEADLVVQLETPHRWDSNRELGDWLIEVRTALQAGLSVPLSTAPHSVKLYSMDGVGDVNPNSKHVGPGLGRTLSPVLRSLRGQIAVLVRYKASVFGIRSATWPPIHIDEGHDLPEAHDATQAAMDARNDPPAMITVALELGKATCTGVTKKVMDDARACFQQGKLDLGRRRSAPPLVGLLEPLMADPTLKGFATFARGLLHSPPPGIQPALDETLAAIASLTEATTDDPHGFIAARIRLKRPGPHVSGPSVLTIHKAKGRAFDHVLVVHCSAGSFPMDEVGAKLLYVAMSRARGTVHLLSSDTHRSPLLGTAG